uniref:AlNc14C34G3074 protein n=1 Tax=Albugo laibachii Nc14 TaxID=890382 RepID=F0W8E4_9STRA|nr:AlNc14C34G3074 [Albugo laibachii Nc14]|eukprot:CCA17399.1 AlNc14C34G3074 [Albugo laibachii Nc14]
MIVSIIHCIHLRLGIWRYLCLNDQQLIGLQAYITKYEVQHSCKTALETLAYSEVIAGQRRFISNKQYTDIYYRALNQQDLE